MKITQVTVRRLRTIPGQYNNVSVEATALVQDSETPEAVRHILDIWVQGQLEGKTVEQLEETARTLEWKTDALKREHTRLSAEIEEMRIERSRTKKGEPLELEDE